MSWMAVARAAAKEEQQGLRQEKRGDKSVTARGEWEIGREDEKGRHGEPG